MPDENRIDQFVLAEYAALREEIKWIIGQIEILERTALIFSGAIWAWVGAQVTWKPIYAYVAALPFVISILFLINRVSLRRALREAAVYVRKIEEHFDLPEGIGWEHHLYYKKPSYFRVWKYAFWFVLILFNFVMAFLMIYLNR